MWIPDIWISGSLQRHKTKCHSNNATCNKFLTNWCNTSLSLGLVGRFVYQQLVPSKYINSYQPCKV